MTLAAGLLAIAAVQQPDQMIPVTRGSKLDVNDFAGDVVIKVWDKDAVRVESSDSARQRVNITTSETLVRVRPANSLGPARSIDLQITVPPWMPIKLTGTYTDMTIEGAQADLTIETVKGDIKVKGGTGFISAKSIQGEVSVENAKGKMKLSSVNEGVKVANSSGELTIETVNGEIALDHVDTNSLDISTVNGDLSYDGPIKDGGQYVFATHNGDITITVPERANATVTVRTFNGDFESTFPVKAESTSRHNKRFTFTVGSGSARLDLESFGGTIRLRRPGEPVRKVKENEKDKDDEDEDQETEDVLVAAKAHGRRIGDCDRAVPPAPRRP